MYLKSKMEIFKLTSFIFYGWFFRFRFTNEDGSISPAQTLSLSPLDEKSFGLSPFIVFNSKLLGNKSKSIYCLFYCEV